MLLKGTGIISLDILFTLSEPEERVERPLLLTKQQVPVGNGYFLITICLQSMFGKFCLNTWAAVIVTFMHNYIPLLVIL